MSDELKATIVELRQAREDWKRSGICYSRFITLAWEHLPAILDALEHQRAELKRIGEDQDYLNRANIANEWEDRFQTQAVQIERLKAALENRESQLSEIAALWGCDRSAVPMVAEWSTDAWNSQKAKLQKAEAALAEAEKRAHRLAHAIDPRSETPRAERPVEQLEAWADGMREEIAALTQERDAAYRAVGNEQELAVQMQNERDAAIARVEHWRKMHGDQGNLLDSAIKRAEKAETYIHSDDIKDSCELKEAREKLERAEADTRRMDWLESITIEASCPPQSRGAYAGLPAHKMIDFDCTRNLNLREAIDTAIAKQPQSEAEAQRQSFAYGNTSIGNPRITKELVKQQAKQEPTR